MAGGDLFGDLPPPSSAPQPKTLKFSEPNGGSSKDSKTTDDKEPSASSPPPPPPQAPPPALKSALKRSKPSSQEEPKPEVALSGKRLRFKTSTDASEAQVIEAMKKIASHIKNPSKFSKASKLALQLIQAGSVKPATSDHFFAILEVAMSSSTACNEASLRGDYHALFSAAQDAAEFFNNKQKNLLTTWTIRAVVANDLLTDDSFVFSKASGRVKEAISSLPVATKDDDDDESATLAGQVDVENANEQAGGGNSSSVDEGKVEEPDPFGLDALIPSTSRKEDRMKGKKEAIKTKALEEEEAKNFLRRQREALITCLETAARRYKTPWCQTVIDILVKHAFDNISRFTSQQREAIDKLWASIREQHIRRKQGKSVSGKLDVNAFEWLQQKYANEKISIRHSVGGSGERHCEQWLG
ncbi:OLC1v1026494C1 [Oldenlandia corymbosa var. corymbosa]|uniref:OLC1v1026494C1 n=1 Tax=Oldenlandia corymbosa var. corymbosa TaxID=529605 RepID=A0AAV1C973_OLDCO|nr:OLC1v1026494C1 [Oldenlandia corymbosa var. corymbosa]